MAGTGEESVSGAEDSGPGAENNLLTAGEDSAVPLPEEFQPVPDPQSLEGQSPASQFMASSAEETGAASTIEPVAGALEAAMTEDFEVPQKISKEGISKEGLKAAKSAAGCFSGQLQMFATEASDYSKTCFESRAAFAEALLGVKSLDSAVRIQTGYAKSAYARFLAHVMKMSGLYLNLLGEAAKPIEKVMVKTSRAKA